MRLVVPAHAFALGQSNQDLLRSGASSEETYTRGRAILSCGGKAWCKQGSADGENGEETEVPESQHSLSDLRSIIQLFLNNQPLQPDRVTHRAAY
jgi:hypothetical protein